ncbi:hypothetical protein ACP3TY_07155 [Pseudomonas rustica]
MNTPEEIQQAFVDFQTGQFLTRKLALALRIAQPSATGLISLT